MTTRERAACVVLAVALGGCTQQYPQTAGALPAPRESDAVARRAARAQVAERARRLESLLGQVRVDPRVDEALSSLRIVGGDEGRVPDFELRAAGGEPYSSTALVGQQPFVAVFFATWCDYCKDQLRSLARALDQVGPMVVIPVSADGSETWNRVPGYLASFGIHQPVVRAHEYPRFSISYDPFDTVPVLVIVGRNGELVDYHVGYDPSDADRLVASLRLAKTAGPLSL
jgi:hypothetical protein